MKLSEAIRVGDTLRPAAYQERFCQVEGRGLCSDVWGAACEAVQPAVANFNWNQHDRFKFASTMDAFVAVQMHYFRAYWSMPARCPGSLQSLVKKGGRIVNHYGRQSELKVYDEGARIESYAITNECDKVEHLAGLVDHLFYKHRCTRPQIAEMVRLYEQARERGQQQRTQLAIAVNFNHYALTH